MKVNFYHNLSETYDMEKVEALVRRSLGHNRGIQMFIIEVYAMRGGDPVFLRIEALDNRGQWRTWPSGYVHLSRYA